MSSLFRRALRWGGLAVCVAMLAVFVVTHEHGRALYTSHGYFGVAQGLIGIGWYPPPSGGLPQLWGIEGFGYHQSGLLWIFDGYLGRPSGWVAIPLWALFIPAAGLTLLAWRSASVPNRDPPGERCSGCGYNLTGNASGQCPECGRSVPSRGAGTARNDGHGHRP